MNLVEVEKLLKKEIEVFDGIEQLFVAKKETLISADIKSLRSVDEKIQELSEKAAKIQQERLNICNCSLSEVIEQAKNNNQNTKIFLDLKENFDKKVKNIELLNRTTEELLVHAMKLVNSNINIIINAVTPKTAGYDKTGKTKGANSLGVSSVIKRV